MGARVEPGLAVHGFYFMLHADLGIRPMMVSLFPEDCQASIDPEQNHACARDLAESGVSDQFLKVFCKIADDQKHRQGPDPEPQHEQRPPIG